MSVISLMPGPVEIAAPVRVAFERPPVSHRGPEFVEQFEALRARLGRLAGTPHVALLQGSGTLANEAIAAHLEGPGLVLINGEFGQRIAEQAKAWGLPVRTVASPWGQPWDLDRAAKTMDGVRWVWAVHLETSTGMLNDLAPLKQLVQARGARLCLDCVSSLGAAPLDLRGVWLASGVSGKALGSYAGIAMVFASEIPSARRAPTYLDLATAFRTQGSRFTFSSPLLAALDAALDLERGYDALGPLVRDNLRRIGIAPMVEGAQAAPTVTTFAEPSAGFLGRCRDLGYALGGESSYLRNRGLAQVATMGAVAAHHIEKLFRLLA
jgi:aspartate aminotransferase-like enzyme